MKTPSDWALAKAAEHLFGDNLPSGAEFHIKKLASVLDEAIAHGDAEADKRWLAAMGFVPDCPATWEAKLRDGFERPLEDAQTERILRGVLERMTASAKERGDAATVDSLADINGLILEAMAARKKVQNESAGKAAAPELLRAGWSPDVTGGHTYWLHSKLAPVIAVPTKKALTLQRERGDKT